MATSSVGPAFRAGEAIREGWRLTRENIGGYLLLCICTGLITTAANFIMMGIMGAGFSVDENGIMANPMVFFVQYLVILLLSLLLSIAMTKFALEVVDGKNPSVSNAFRSISARKLLHLFLAVILFCLGVGFGMILLIVPGIILGLAWSMLQYPIVDKGVGAIDALKESMQLTKGSRGQIFLFNLLLVLLVVVMMLLPMLVMGGAFFGLLSGSLMPEAGTILSGFAFFMLYFLVAFILMFLISGVQTFGLAWIYRRLQQRG